MKLEAIEDQSSVIDDQGPGTIAPEGPEVDEIVHVGSTVRMGDRLKSSFPRSERLAKTAVLCEFEENKVRQTHSSFPWPMVSGSAPWER